MSEKTGLKIEKSIPLHQEMTLKVEHYLKHAARRFSRPRIHMGVRYGPMLRGTDAQALLEDARAWINVRLGENPMYRGQS